MSVTQLRSDPGRQAVELVGAARAAVVAGAGLDARGWGEDRLGEAVAELAALESQVVSWRLALAAEAERRRVAEGSAETGTDAWLARLTGDRREVARGGVWLAGLLQSKYEATRAALAAGRLRLEQVRVIVRAAERAPKGVTPEQVRVAEEALVAKATGEGTRSGRAMNARRLRVEARRMFATISPRLADEHEGAELASEEERALAQSWLSLHDQGDGTFKGSFVIPERHGHALRAVLQRLTSPRRLGRDRARRLVVDPSVPGEQLSWAEHNAHAFCELIEHLPTTGWRGGNIATLLVLMDHDKLLAGIGAARLDTGVRISPAAARHLACEAGIVPMVLNGASVPLDRGRESRLHTEAQRQALAVLHDSCGIAGCERPFAWCEIHHPEPWAAGGLTDLVNGLPLCGYHHRCAHDDRFDLRRHPNGEWRFHPRR